MTSIPYIPGIWLDVIYLLPFYTSIVFQIKLEINLMMCVEHVKPG